MKKFIMPLLLALSLTTALPFSVASPSSTRQVISVWSEIVIEEAEAYSHSSAYAVRDCLRPSPIDCFSLQQNFWITDVLGNLVLWARNSVYLANLSGAYHGTYSFQVYGRNDRYQPLVCEPESNSTSTCRSPFYADYSPFPQSLEFYSHISDGNRTATLQMSNNFGAITWAIPSTIICPCFIQTTPGQSQPWGSWPYELVAVGVEASMGVDSTATATFRNETKGRIGPSLVQYADETWHLTSLSPIHCTQFANCISMLSSQENSLDLVWDSEESEFHWMDGAMDQGVHIAGIKPERTEPPTLPTPRNETYLYVRFYSALAYLSVYDQLRRIVGIDPQTGHPADMVPNSSLVLSSYIPVKDRSVLEAAPNEELMILNPRGTYEIRVTAGGNTAYNIFLSKTSNTNQVLAKRIIVGALVIGDSKSLEVESSDLALSSGTSSFPGILSVIEIITFWISVVLVILVVLTLRRKRMRRLRPDFDDF